MENSLDRVNKLIKDMEPSEIKQTDIILSGPDTMKNILMNETIKLAKLEQVSNQLINYISDPKQIKELSYREKQFLLKTITDIQANSRDFIFKVAELSTKNDFIREVLKIHSEPTETVISENGEIIQSSITSEQRIQLSMLLRDLLDERISNE